MSIQTIGPFWCGGGPIRHSAANAGAAIRAALPASAARRERRDLD
jgi:hypothetical protein